MTGKTPPLERRAGADQIGHLYEGGRKPARLTLCGVPLPDIRLAWPPVINCPDCQMVREKGVAAA